ncbi:DUF4149 domain-containing protein [Persephonella sp. IF05-L8]|uniref:DUF4149 domain-containing protein n=1 Tax=Persephonella sp. IF05-L8 TaxID=1158338 RepID=UPI000495ECD5
MSKYIDVLILLLIGILIGANIWTTFVVAPVIFSHFDKKTAGDIMNLIFPYYFASGWVVGVVIYTFIGIKSIKDKGIIRRYLGFIIALSILILSHMALHKTVLPMARTLNHQYYQLLQEEKKADAEKIHSKFKTLHTISSLVNLFNLAIEVYLFQYYFLRSRKERNS